MENGVLLPSLRPMLPLLDLHGIKRLDFHNSVLEVCICQETNDGAIKNLFDFAGSEGEAGSADRAGGNDGGEGEGKEIKRLADQKFSCHQSEIKIIDPKNQC